MLNRISDLRNAPNTLYEAKVLFDELARHCIDLVARDAQLERRVARLKAEHAGETEDLLKDIAAKEIALKEFINSRRDLFKDPRKVKTDFGAFGLQAVSDVEIKDEEAVLKAVVKRKLEDCFKLSTKLVVAGIKTQLEAGEKIPGCALRSGDTAVYKIEKALIDRAKENCES